MSENIVSIFQGETDWKVIAIDASDPMAKKLSDISDVDVHMPGLLKETVHWFRVYKVSVLRVEIEYGLYFNDFKQQFYLPY